MKMNWGTGIVLTIVGFVALILVMVVISVRMEGIELVTENYYEEEIKYQDRIDQIDQASELGRDVIAYNSQQKLIELDLPNGSTGSLQFFRPSDSSLDQSIPVKVVKDDVTIVPVDRLKPGYWKIKLEWSENGVRHYQEKKITI
ncbi:FixH family protein [Algoriphagus halophytocola]|uniref:FixH family protein n=1 Tax=Algoriphagus halophytocola TaxID=2991499 RepID=A0ABY6MFF2_9BACT|nr:MULTISPECIES: FixH family protein [unclassified Algoriphagus]UZD22545.1 FixH family protein [Algoriphagus sp. TR-M5]WBL43808.1 FixH family protein [Algoriphagus sp. TR-M9]